MIICAAGDIHGAMDRFYEDVLTFENHLAVRFAWILHVGDFGVWPDPNRLDKATWNHGGAGDFPRWHSERRRAPRQTVFIKGNHEDFAWLEERRGQGQFEVVPGIRYLPNGEVFEIESDSERLRIGGIGGCHGPSNYEKHSKNLQGRERRHFTHDEIMRLCGRKQIDILLLHNAPAGVEFIWRRPDGSVRRRYASEAEGLAEAISRTRPIVCFFGHHHTRLDAEVAGVRCIGLNKVRCPGNLVAIDIAARGRAYEILGEWPPRTRA